MKKQENKPKRKYTRKAKVEEKTIQIETIDITQTQEPEQKLESIGLGDTIAKVTSFFGIKKCIPCEERQKKFNKYFPWIDWDKELLKGNDEQLMRRVLSTPEKVESKDVDALFALYNRLFQGKRPLKRCTCPGLLKQIVDRLSLLLPPTDNELTQE